MTRTVLRARWILPIDRPPIAGGYVCIEGGKIVSVGLESPSGSVEDLGDAVLLPGFVNAHTHLEFSGLSQPLGEAGMSLPAWIRLVIADRRRTGRDVAASIASGMSESLRHGVTTIGEIATSPAAPYETQQPGPTVVRFQEAIGFSGGRVESVATEVERRLDESPNLAGVSPHAPYTVHPRLVERLVQLAASRAAPMAMHLAESREELTLLADGDGPFREVLEERSMWDAEAISAGTRPMDYLRILAKAPRALVIHGNYLGEDEIAFLGRHRDHMSVVYCPRTHGYFRHDPYPLAALRTAGAHVVVGTDSRASNPDLSMLRELKCVAELHPGVQPDELLRMATLGGAESLGLVSEVGSLSPGKRADLVAFACGPHLANPYDFLQAPAEATTRVWIAGREVDMAPQHTHDAS